MQLSKERKQKNGQHPNNFFRGEDAELLEENMSLKQKIEIMKSREDMRRVLADPYADPIVDLPMEYVQYCTKNFALQRRLSQGGTGDVFLAMDDQVEPKIQYVVKRVQVDHHQAKKADLFRRELEVNKADKLVNVNHCVFLHWMLIPEVLLSAYYVCWNDRRYDVSIIPTL